MIGYNLLARSQHAATDRASAAPRMDGWMDGCISGNEANRPMQVLKEKTKATEEKENFGGYLCGS